MNSTTEKNFQMVDVGHKNPADRIATARGSLIMGLHAFKLLKDNALPKGDALRLAEIAGIQGAKRTSELIPLCHPLSLDNIDVRFDLDPELPGAHAFCTAKSHAKTGVEMEALTGVSCALLALYDVVKQVDPALTLSEIRLEEKIGGKSGLWRHPNSPLAKGEGWVRAPSPHLSSANADEGARKPNPPCHVAAITVSDRCFRGQAEDRSGLILSEGLKSLGFHVEGELLPDEKDLIALKIKTMAAHMDAIVLTGGTGLSERDVTPEAVESVCQRMIPGIAEALRRAGGRSTPMSALSRCVAGQIGRCIVIALPGSTGGVRDGLQIIKEVLPHAIHIVRGGNHG